MVSVTGNILVLYDYEEQPRVLGEVEIDLFDLNNEFVENLNRVYEI